jgi:hypothetical protein
LVFRKLIKRNITTKKSKSQRTMLYIKINRAGLVLEGGAIIVIFDTAVLNLSNIKCNKISPK